MQLNIMISSIFKTLLVTIVETAAKTEPLAVSRHMQQVRIRVHGKLLIFSFTRIVHTVKTFLTKNLKYIILYKLC